jgi:alkanesulfonate monooxygenase SsuD/methylene tetrahydromethanopterin reductase-like flavin-dependent oxidoreductase (luciferase family)
MKVGVTLKMYDYRTYAPKPVADIARQAARAEELGYDSVWVMDHVLIQRGERRVMAHDPLIALAHVAAATRRVTIGSLVLCLPFRHPVQLAREAAAISDLAPGRFVLGIGCGWHQPEFDALDLPFDHLVSRFEEAVGPVQRLLRGEHVDCDGRWLRLSDASVAVTSPAPATWIAAEGPRMMRAAARVEGWTHAYWGAGDTAAFRAASERLDEALRERDRDPDSIERSAAIACVPGGWEPIPGLFSEDAVETGGVERLAEVVRGYGEAGADQVILSLSPDPFAELDPSLLERSARLLELL